MSDLPKFDRPPVSEVVMSVQFEPVPNLTIAHLAAWWHDVAENRYPLARERPPVDAQLERFDNAGPSLSLKFGPSVAPVALWLFDKDETELVQVQADRFTRNWTRTGSETYPSYAALKPRFDQDFQSLRDHLRQQGFPPLVATQCELTYLNPIEPGMHWSRPGELNKVIAPWSGRFSEPFLREPEAVQLAARWMVESGGAPVGRFTAEVTPMPAGGTTKILLTLQCRLRPLATGQPGIDASLELAHEWIVWGFASLTTEQMWTTWERTQ